MTNLPGAIAIRDENGGLHGAFGASGAYSGAQDVVCTMAAINATSSPTAAMKKPSVTLDQSWQLLNTALATCQSLNKTCTVAVADAGGFTKLMVSGNGVAPLR